MIGAGMRLPARPAEPISAAMSFRLFSALLVALALVFAPAAMASGAGMKAAHASAQAANADGHCHDSKPASNENRSDMARACAIACAACLAVTPAMTIAVPPEPVATARTDPAALTGLDPDKDTPPPRGAPAI